MEKTKVLIVGGGPAGATAAKLLAENRIDVILLERNLSFVKPCGGGIPLSAFEEFNIPRTPIKKEVKNIKVISPKGEALEIELKSGSLAIVERGEFGRCLRNISEKKGAKIIEGEFVRFIKDKETYKIEAHIGKETIEILSEYIIAADGVNSRVRAFMGIKPPASISTLSEHIRGLKTESCEFWFGSSYAPVAYSWVFPTADGVSAGTGSIKKEKIRLLFERFKKRRGITEEGQKRSYRIPLWKGDLYNKDRIIFAGDSAGHVLPLACEGIYYAMKAGEFAAMAIIERNANNYKKIWKSMFQKRFALMNRLRNYFLKDDISIEKLVALHRIPEVQEASMRLWLRKDNSSLGIKEYIRLFRKFLR